MMTAKEKRACMACFLMHNEPMSSIRLKGLKERPPVFFLGTPRLNGKLGDDQSVICLPLWPLLTYASEMEEAVEELVSYIMSIQDEGPYLLGGFCYGGFVAYELARRLESRGHSVDLLALVESPGVGQADRLFRLRRRLLFSVTQPIESLRILMDRIASSASQISYNKIGANKARINDEFYGVIDAYCRVRLRSGLLTYEGRLTLFYGDRSLWRLLPTHGWKNLVKGGIEVHLARGDHTVALFETPELLQLIKHCVATSQAKRSRDGCDHSPSTLP
jgi:thioesterase domain-containing protein